MSFPNSYGSDGQIARQTYLVNTNGVSNQKKEELRSNIACPHTPPIAQEAVAVNNLNSCSGRLLNTLHPNKLRYSNCKSTTSDDPRQALSQDYTTTTANPTVATLFTSIRFTIDRSCDKQVVHKNQYSIIGINNVQTKNQPLVEQIHQPLVSSFSLQNYGSCTAVSSASLKPKESYPLQQSVGIPPTAMLEQLSGVTPVLDEIDKAAETKLKTIANKPRRMTLLQMASMSRNSVATIENNLYKVNSHETFNLQSNTENESDNDNESPFDNTPSFTRTLSMNRRGRRRPSEFSVEEMLASPSVRQLIDNQRRKTEPTEEENNLDDENETTHKDANVIENVKPTTESIFPHKNNLMTEKKSEKLQKTKEFFQLVEQTEEDEQ